MKSGQEGLPDRVGGQFDRGRRDPEPVAAQPGAQRLDLLGVYDAVRQPGARIDRLGRRSIAIGYLTVSCRRSLPSSVTLTSSVRSVLSSAFVLVVLVVVDRRPARPVGAGVGSCRRPRAAGRRTEISMSATMAFAAASIAAVLAIRVRESLGGKEVHSRPFAGEERAKGADDSAAHAG